MTQILGRRTFHTVSNPATNTLSGLGAQIGAVLRSMGPGGRRWALAGIGAACALGLGIAAAMMVQLPADMKEPIQAQDQTLAQTELPSVTQARANALNNPPAYPVADLQSTDNTLGVDTPVETTAAVLDETPTGPTATTNTTDSDDTPAELHTATPAPASPAPTIPVKAPGETDPTD